MEHSARLAPIVDRVLWASGPEDLLRVVPELIVETPPLTMLEDGPGVLLSDPGPFLSGVTTYLCDCMEGLASRDPLIDASGIMVRQDPVVAALLPLFLECGRPGTRAQLVPAISLVWAASGLISGRAPWLGHLPGPLAQRWMVAQGKLESATDESRFESVRRIGDRLGARLGAAISLARVEGVAIPAGGLVRRIMTNPLVFAHPHGSLDPGEDLPEVAGLLNAPLDPDMLSHLFAAAELAWSGLRDRVARRKSTPVDSVLHQLAGQATAANALLDPIAGPVFIRSLPELVGVKHLRTSGLDARVARALLSEAALRPLAAAWADLITPLKTWDVVSALSSLVTPIWPTTGGWQIRGKYQRSGARWSLRVPSTRREDHAVVAVRMAEVVEAAKLTHERARDLVQARWRQQIGEFPDAVHTWTGDVGLAAFASPVKAVEFAERIHSSIPGPDGILREEGAGPVVAVSPDLRVGVGLAFGAVDGGTDGECTWLDGAAVGAALSLIGRGSPTLRTHDPLNIRRVVGEVDGLRSNGVASDPSLIQVLPASIVHPIHMHSSGDEAGGISEDFHFYPVPYWWDDGGRVWVWLELGSRLQGGPAELVVLNRVMFRDIHSRDVALQHSDLHDESSAVPGLAESGPELEDKQPPAWHPFDAMEREGLTPTRTEDPWARLDANPVVEIDDE